MITYTPEVYVEESAIQAIHWQGLDDRGCASFWLIESRRCQTWEEAIERLERFGAGRLSRVVVNLPSRILPGEQRRKFARLVVEIRP